MWAILSTVLCCLPLGIAAIVFASRVNGKWESGDVEGARDSSRKARTFAIASAASGVLLFAIAMLLGLLGAATGSA
ncbi:MAG: CD225/dispanin family protein [Actinomycetota bacterium]|nr:CD225/dispanin family protein [Actinomycetota bacterium]